MKRFRDLSDHFVIKITNTSSDHGSDPGEVGIRDLFVKIFASAQKA